MCTKLILYTVKNQRKEVGTDRNVEHFHMNNVTNYWDIAILPCILYACTQKSITVLSEY